MPIPVLHVVTSDDIVARADFVEQAHRVMLAGGARLAFHLRAPRLRPRALYELACRIAALQGETGAWLVVNDRIDVALTAVARGVQLTSRSLSPADARRCAPTLAIGASVHAVDDARAAVDAGVDWLVVGHGNDAESAPRDRQHVAELITRLTAEPSLPLVAIGGIRPEHVPALRAAGVYGVAVIRGVWRTSDAGAAVIDYLSAHGAPGGR